jgi:two-component system sensor histidine kinase PrrB
VRRPVSLQFRVACACALSAAVVVGAVGIAVAVFLRLDSGEQLSTALSDVTIRAAEPAPDTILPFEAPTGPAVELPPPPTQAGALPADGAELTRLVAVSGAPGRFLTVSVP